MPRVSVVVPTYKRPEMLDRCLAALVEQDFNQHAYDIWIADNAASEATRTQVERWAASIAAPAIHYVAAAQRRGPAAARNAGWRAAKGEIIAFTDDDCIPSAGWLRAGASAVECGAAAVTGRVIVPLPERPTDYERDAAGLASPQAEFVTANCFIVRGVLEELGGYDETFSMAWREDSDLHFRLLEQRCEIVRAEDAVIIHPVRPERWGISLKQQRKTMFNALLYKKHPRLYRERIQQGPPLRYYGIATGALAGALGGILASPVLAASGGALWLALTAQFAAMRLKGTSQAPSHVAEMIVTSALIPFLSIIWRLYGAVKFRTLFL